MFENYIDGDWTPSDGGETFERRNPADTRDVIGGFQQSTREDARRAIDAAVAAQEAWATTPGPTRGQVLNRTAHLLEERKEDLAETLTREEGKTLAESRPEVQRAIDIFYYYAQRARDFGGEITQASSPGMDLYTVKEPLGTVSIITPWNYPIAIPAWKIAPALATGNTVVFKPAALAPNVARKLIACLDEAGAPDGVVNYLTGPGDTVGDELVVNDRVDGISFTGSAAVGTMVYENAAPDLKRVQTEMGGKNPTVVSEHADIELAVDTVGVGGFGVTGQACTACSRAIVHESVVDEFVERLVAYAEGLEIGPGLDGYDMGPQVSDGELASTLDYVEVAEGEGATIVTGGSALSGGRFDHGHFVEPTVVTGVESSMRIAQEEVFGPLVAVIEYGDFEAAIAIANDVHYGLSSSIITTDHSEAKRFVEGIEAGVAKVNQKTTGLELHVPFGGIKRSSSNTYREQGSAGLEFFTWTKTVYDAYEG